MSGEMSGEMNGEMNGGGETGDWYYCLKHQQVEQGLQCPAKNRLGPYPTREAAEHALERVAERNQDWDEDPRWS
jgi:hypothetical protein